MNSIEKHKITDSGYTPFLVRDGWQVAQLNYTEDQKIENIHRLDVHNQTDEAFILLEGKVVLISAEIKRKTIKFNVELMKPNITYNIPVGCWHNIAMTKGSKVIIIEKSNTHISDFEFFPLTSKHKSKLDFLVETALNE